MSINFEIIKSTHFIRIKSEKIFYVNKYRHKLLQDKMLFLNIFCYFIFVNIFILLKQYLRRKKFNSGNNQCKSV